MAAKSKRCPVKKSEWDLLARGSAATVLKEMEAREYFKRDTDTEIPYVFPADACDILGWSEPTFRKYARKYLMPEIYGELPSDFFFEEDI